MSREKVFDDPLMAFASATEASEPVGTKQAAANASLFGESDETIRTINTDKVNLKQKKAAAAEPTKVAPESIFDSTTPTGAVPTSTKESKGLGFGTALWDNQPISASNDVLFGANTSASSLDSGIFSKQAAPASVDTVPKVGKGGSKFRVAAEENDDAFEDLKVGKLVEREDTSNDAELFGKARVVQGAKGVVETQRAFAKTKRDDFDLVSNDTIANLESATVERKAAAPSSVFTNPSLLSAQVTQADEVDLSTLDINAYINQQSSSQGGLFD
jgi:hypothetical protein